MRLLENSAWQMAHRFSKFSRDFSIKNRESIVGEIEEQFFCRALCGGNFLLGKKIGEIDPRSQFMRSFFYGRSQNRKKPLMT